MGVCCVLPTSLAKLGLSHPGATVRHRRIDIKAYPSSGFACAILYFPGSAHFNRSMRLYAKKHGWKLSDRDLTHKDGTCVVPRTEQEVFKVLDMEFKSPAQRDV